MELTELLAKSCGLFGLSLLWTFLYFLLFENFFGLSEMLPRTPPPIVFADSTDAFLFRESPAASSPASFRCSFVDFPRGFKLSVEKERWEGS